MKEDFSTAKTFFLINVMLHTFCQAKRQEKAPRPILVHCSKHCFVARLESLPCAADFSAMHFKFQPRFQPQNFRKTTKGNNRTIV